MSSIITYHHDVVTGRSNSVGYVLRRKLSKGLLKAIASVILHEKTTLIVNKGGISGKRGRFGAGRQDKVNCCYLRPQ